jgi:hypothetical protein
MGMGIHTNRYILIAFHYQSNHSRLIPMLRLRHWKVWVWERWLENRPRLLPRNGVYCQGFGRGQEVCLPLQGWKLGKIFIILIGQQNTSAMLSLNMPNQFSSFAVRLVWTLGELTSYCQESLQYSWGTRCSWNFILHPVLSLLDLETTIRYGRTSKNLTSICIMSFLNQNWTLFRRVNLFFNFKEFHMLIF